VSRDAADCSPASEPSAALRSVTLGVVTVRPSRCG
jgi:hypothetical protein